MSSGKRRISKLFDIKKDAHGRRYMEVALDGIALLRLVLANKGTAFSHEERIELNLDGLLPRLVRARGLSDADDIASVLHHRLARATARPVGSGRTRQAPRLIAGLIPYAAGVTDPEMHAALVERQQLIEQRANAVLARDLDEGAPWTGALGRKPADAKTAGTWRRFGQVVAAYRDRHVARGRCPADDTLDALRTAARAAATAPTHGKDIPS